jgi:predicted alpha/beta-fold hydrolase
MIVKSSFEPPWWLSNSHVQTIYPVLFNNRLAEIDYFERMELPDGDFIDLAWAIHGLNNDSPLVVLLHGLGGNIHSSYVAGLLKSFNKAGYRALLMHFRGASGEPNRLPRVYHSGETGDLDYLLHNLQQREPNTRKAVVGISLGGNVLLKWLGEIGNQSLIDTAVAVSVPFQLDLVVECMNKGFARIYQTYLLRGFRSVFCKKLPLINTTMPLTKEELFSLKTLFDFDERITAPLHGFKNAQAYYKESSSRQYLSSIRTPTLILHALDDPFMNAKAVPDSSELSSYTTLELSKQGGHVGFITGNHPKKLTSWLNQRIPNFLANYL